MQVTRIWRPCPEGTQLQAGLCGRGWIRYKCILVDFGLREELRVPLEITLGGNRDFGCLGATGGEELWALGGGEAELA